MITPPASPTASPTPVIIAIQPGQPTTVTAAVSNVVATLDLPPGAPGDPQVSTVTLGAASVDWSTLVSGAYQPIVGLSVGLSDGSGAPIDRLGSPLRVTLQFQPGSANPALARVLATTSNGAVNPIPSTLTPNQDGTWSATAMLDRPGFVGLAAPGRGTPVPQAYVPLIQR